MDRHLTLIFLGELEPQRLGCVESAVSRMSAPSFALELDRVGCFARSQVLWCGPSRTPAPLTALVSDLQTRIRACGIAPETRPYRPHLTLARKVRSELSLALSTAVIWRVSELVLAHGQRGAAPRYRIERRWPLDPVGV